jgi:hypothetical protein
MVIGGTTLATVLVAVERHAILAIPATTALLVGAICWVLASKARSRRLRQIIRAIRRSS